MWEGLLCAVLQVDVLLCDVMTFMNFFKCDLGFQIFCCPLYMYCSDPFNLCASYCFGLLMIPPTRECVSANVQQMGRRRGTLMRERMSESNLPQQIFIYQMSSPHPSLSALQATATCLRPSHENNCVRREGVFGGTGLQK